jgi:hypothetical protein
MGKYLTESDWNGAIKRFRAMNVVVADNGLGKVLAGLEKLAEVIRIASKLKTTLADGVKTAKAQKAKPEVLKNVGVALDHVTGLLDEAQAEQDKTSKARDKAAADDRKKGEAEDAKRPVLGRLVEVSKKMSGSIQKAMAIAEKAGDPGYKQLWYYNSHAVFQFVKYDQKDSVREEMIKAGGGKLPFTGTTWVVYPFQKNLSLHCPPGCEDKNLTTFLRSLDDDIRTSLDPMFKAQGTEVKSAFGDKVDDFIKHVGKLGGDKSHLYSAY